MKRIQDAPPLGILGVPVYVIRMGWHRWGLAAQLRWLHKLRDACLETAETCDRMIKHYEEQP